MIDRATKFTIDRGNPILKTSGLMSGATLRVKSRMADLCRAISSVSVLVLDSYGWFIDSMFIATETRTARTPSGVPCPGYHRIHFTPDGV